MLSDNSVDSNRIVYTPSTFARTSLLYLQETGSLSAVKAHTSNRSCLDSYLFFTVCEGFGELKYDEQIYKLSTGDCIFINCNKPYSHTTVENLWKLQWVHFNGENMDGIYRRYQERGGRPVFHPKNVIVYTDLLNEIYKIAISEDYLRDMQVNEQLSALLTRIMEMSWVPENQIMIKRGYTREYSLQDIKAYLDANWTEIIVLDDLANKFFINKYYMTRLFKTQFGVSIINYVTNFRVTQAKRMLRFSDSSVENIGRECGFDDPNYFTRTFRKVEGVTPTEYRRMWMR